MLEWQSASAQSKALEWRNPLELSEKFLIIW